MVLMWLRTASSGNVTYLLGEINFGVINFIITGIRFNAVFVMLIIKALKRETCFVSSSNYPLP